MRGFILLIFLGSALVAARSQQDDRIVGGIDADIEKYPYMAVMQFDWYEGAWRLACGGSIITIRTILSAAHCFEQRNAPSHWRARVGSSYPNSGGQLHTIEKFILHENYNDLYLNNDVAIAVLVAPVTFSASVGTARIASHSFNLPDGTQVTSIGWGRLVWQGDTPDQLQEVNNYIINQQLCWERYEELRTMPDYLDYPEVTSKMICAGVLGTGGRDSCTGDSGGPVVYDGDVIIGITSWAYGCADPVYPGVKARVSSFVNWIIANGSW